MIPEIEFIYSFIYDGAFMTVKYKKWPEYSKAEIKKFKKDMNKYLKDLEKMWKKEGRQILQKIQTVSGFSWKEKKIKVYIVSEIPHSFSDPLTLNFKYRKDMKISRDVLTHELLHQIQIQNEKKINKYYDQIYKNYKKELRVTKSHIFVHAAHKKIYLELSGEDRLKIDIKKCQKWPGYKRAWEIVEEEGYENILNEFKKLTK
jgi:hypothetical protein